MPRHLPSRSRLLRRRRGTALLAAALSLSSVAVHAQTPDPVSARSLGQAVTPFQPALGGPRQAGSKMSPVPIGNLKPAYQTTDITLNGSLGNLSLTRHFSHDVTTWDVFDIVQGRIRGAPFGERSGERSYIHWWHSFFSYVDARPEILHLYEDLEEYHAPEWHVREPGGGVYSFDPCPTNLTTPCMAQPRTAFELYPVARTVRTTGGDAELQWDGTGFVLFKRGQGRYVFRHLFSETVHFPSDEIRNIYYLTEIQDIAGRTVATLTYAPGSTQVSEVITPEGTRLRFHYQTLAWQDVLSWVGIVDAQGAETEAVRYDYSTNMPGLLSASKRPSGDGGYRDVVTYDYGNPAPGEALKKWEVHAGGSFVQQLMGWYGGAISSDQDADGTRTISGQNVNPQKTCPPGSLDRPEDDGPYSCDWQQYQRLSRTFTSNGSGTTQAPVTLKDEYLVEMLKAGPTVRSRTESCIGAYCGDAQSRSSEWDWGLVGEPADLVTLWQRGPMNNYTRYGYATSPAGRPELNVIAEGASNGSGNGALRTRTFAHVDGAASGGYVERLVDAEFRPSVFTGGQYASVKHRYDAQNRLVATFKTGHTHELQGTSWVPVLRTVGTFYFTQQVCSGSNAQDPLGRVVEIHGPCKVAGANATDCDAGAPVPVTQLDYYPAGTPANKAHRLAEVRAFVGATANNCTSAPALETAFTAYDARGRALENVDPNGTITRFVFDRERLVRTERGDGPGAMRVAEYGYDDVAQKMLWAREPTGEYEVTCYREGTSRATGCVGGTVSHHLQWKARSPSSSGANWTEAVLYTYQDGRLVYEQTVDATGQARQTRTFDADAFGRTTFTKQGSGTHAPVIRRAFDAGDHLTRLGLPLNQAPDFCMVNEAGTTWRPCAELAYDRMGRQTQLRQFPTADVASGTTTCLAYDLDGNMSRWVSDCATDCATCLIPLADHPITDYKHDDFGQLVQVTAPWFKKPDYTTGGAVRMEYDAQGHVTRRQLPSQGTSKFERYTYDTLGRELKADVYSQYTTEVLSTSAYDGFTADGDCPTISTPHRRGRLVSRVDGEGKTCFSYDQDGNITRADRVLRPTDRVNDVTPFVGASTKKAFDSSGRLTEQTYPDGRRVHYFYWTGTSQVKSIWVNLRSPNGSEATTELIRNIQWAPGGALRSYEIVAVQAAPGAQSITVEYLPSDGTAPAANASCGMTRPNGDDGNGRIGGLWVSTSPDAGDVYKARYGWMHDQLWRQAECVRNASVQGQARVTSYFGAGSQMGYDATLQLTDTTEKHPDGQLRSRAYGYDARGNRTTETNGPTFHYDYPTFGNFTPVDQLAKRDTIFFTIEQMASSWRYGYNADGRELYRMWNGWDDYLETYPDYDPERTESVWTTPGASPGRSPTEITSTVGVDYADAFSISYRHVHDASGRRVRKEYQVTHGTADELFWNGTTLLEDRGNAKIAFAPDEPRTFPVDQYIWLAGRPVLMLKAEVAGGSKNAPSFARKPDFEGACSRNGEASKCGVYFMVNDPLGRPVLMLDGAGKVAGTGEYDPFGHVNREQRQISTHPYQGDWEDHGHIGTISVADVPGLSTEVRARLPYVDVEESDMLLVHKNYGALRGGHTFGRKWGPAMTGWYANEPGLTLSLEWCDPGTGPEPAWGVAVDRVEYRRHEPGVTPVWTRLRMPGQYYDPETDLVDNWFRTYDPSSGRFTSIDPMLLSPAYVAERLAQGRAPRAYAYTSNNPIAFTDPTGLASEGEIQEIVQEVADIEKKLADSDAAMRKAAVEAEDAALFRDREGEKLAMRRARKWAKVGVELEMKRYDLLEKLKTIRKMPGNFRAILQGGGEVSAPRGNLKIARVLAVIGLGVAAVGAGNAEASSGPRPPVEVTDRPNPEQQWRREVHAAADQEWEKGNYVKSIIIRSTSNDPPFKLDGADRY